MNLTSLTHLDASGGLRLALMGMSGVGKTHISNMLRASGDWYHYCVDYRLGQQYLAPHINDDLRSHAMKDPVFARLLRADAMALHGKVSMGNLDVLTEYLGKIGAHHKGGRTRDDVLHRQEVHRRAEVAAMGDTDAFLHRASTQYGYPNFVCDCSGSLCSVVDPTDAEDPILSALAAKHVLLYLDIEEADVARLIAHFRKRPKPIYYGLPFFEACEAAYLEPGQSWDQVDPTAFATWAFERIMDYRLPRYRAIAKAWGFIAPPRYFDGVKDTDRFLAMLEELLQSQARTPMERHLKTIV